MVEIRPEPVYTSGLMIEHPILSSPIHVTIAVCGALQTKLDIGYFEHVMRRIAKPLKVKMIGETMFTGGENKNLPARYASFANEELLMLEERLTKLYKAFGRPPKDHCRSISLRQGVSFCLTLAKPELLKEFSALDEFTCNNWFVEKAGFSKESITIDSAMDHGFDGFVIRPDGTLHKSYSYYIPITPNSFS